MKYFGRNGKLIKSMVEPYKFMRSINIILTRPGTFNTHTFLSAILKEDKIYIKEVHFDHSYKRPDGRISHTYKLFFEVSGLAGDAGHEAKIMINELTSKIEKRIEQDCNVELHNVHDRDEYWRRHIGKDVQAFNNNECSYND